jgi:hypothetical protein
MGHALPCASALLAACSSTAKPGIPCARIAESGRPPAARPSLVSPRLQDLPVRCGSGRTTHSACASPRVGTCKGRGARQAEPAACVDLQRTIIWFRRHRRRPSPAWAGSLRDRQCAPHMPQAGRPLAGRRSRNGMPPAFSAPRPSPASGRHTRRLSRACCSALNASVSFKSARRRMV